MCSSRSVADLSFVVFKWKDSYSTHSSIMKVPVCFSLAVVG